MREIARERVRTDTNAYERTRTHTNALTFVCWVKKKYHSQIPSNTLAQYLRLKEEQKQIARTEFDGHANHA